MIKVLLCGCNGYMGRVITSCVDARENFEIVAKEGFAFAASNFAI